MYRSAGKLLKWISLRSRHFTMDAEDLLDFLVQDHLKFGHAKKKLRSNSDSNKKASSPVSRRFFKDVSRRIIRVSLRCTPQGKRRQGRPKATWRRTVKKEIKAMGLTCCEAEMVALDRIGLRKRMKASCSARS